jgi:hypothetical protein
VVETGFKALIGSYDEVTGPLPILSYVLDNTGPAAAQWLNSTIEDTVDLAFGDKTFSSYILGFSALTRGM